METIESTACARGPAPAAAAGRRLRAPIVFLHEGLGSVAMWRDWPQQVCARGRPRRLRLFAARLRPVRPRSPTCAARAAWSPTTCTAKRWRCCPSCSSLGVEAPVLLGHSDGGTIALLHASQFPVTACVVMAPHVIVEDSQCSPSTQARAAYETGSCASAWQRYHDDVDVAFWQWNDIWLSPAFRSFDIRAECRRIKAPVLAIQGEDDPYGTLRQIEEIAPTRGPFSCASAAGVRAFAAHATSRSRPGS